jgi:hypothetical protein
MKKLMLVFLGLALILPASARMHPVRVGVGFGPAFGPWGYGYPPYVYGGYGWGGHPNSGQVKIETDVRDAEVLINGAYAGTVRSLKSMWLREGSYNLEIRSPGRARYAERIYVLTGKTLHVRPELRVTPGQ